MAPVEVRAVSVEYQGTRGPVAALEAFTLSVGEGEAIAVIGPSGCGKSTLLLTVAGLVGATEGQVEIAGEAVVRPRLRTALILQDFGLLPWKTVFHNAALGLEIRGVPAAERARLTREALARVGLSDFARAYPGELSGGMRQRLAVARALALEADLLLMDEPLSALDALTREDLQELLLAIWRQRGHTALLVTHSIEEAVFLGRRVVVMTRRPGRVAAVVENPGMGSAGYRATPEFYARCAELRQLLSAQVPAAREDGR
ncbi:MAG: ABC transporter ATP-binding protein [Deltaproteobacteria bacterium]|nr:ABC transporter ATP-binding protein [Deltaproteobacteria bacterium]